MADALLLPNGRIVRRVQRTRIKGQPGMPEGAVYVGRPTCWGNPFEVGKMAPHRHRSGGYPFELYIDHHVPGNAGQVMRLYCSIVTQPGEHEYVGFAAPTMDQIREHLAGRDLACWCPLGSPCHGDVLLRLANPDGVEVTS